MSADVIDLRPILAREIGGADEKAAAKRLADRVFAGAIAELDRAYGREYRRLRLLQTLYAMDRAEEIARG
jgi:hypothetical protein